ncbi:hypothetical protein CDEST_06531 [Colletotrichum destructivum]|uniref:Uncharacterized protein n=1 Tax=Colletotrichum destructivum TaxID=34406 RepID=A0AAX4IDY6_9PEZI|nr:hypothetical protein CDEST_06531 [Colletotrichum destructivum]
MKPGEEDRPNHQAIPPRHTTPWTHTHTHTYLGSECICIQHPLTLTGHFPVNPPIRGPVGSQRTEALLSPRHCSSLLQHCVATRILHSIGRTFHIFGRPPSLPRRQTVLAPPRGRTCISSAPVFLHLHRKKYWWSPFTSPPASHRIAELLTTILSTYIVTRRRQQNFSVSK